MVVLAAALCTKNGKALLSRQFVETTRPKIEGLLAAFPKLIQTDGSKQHTFVETDSIRYVYTPFETLYLVLLTNKGSNIIEDLDTLRLLAKVVPEQCQGQPVTEETVLQRSFELLFAFDEVIASGGYRDDITLHQIRINLEMESHEEKLAQMIKVSKMAEAKEAAKRKAQELREQERERRRVMAAEGGSSSAGGRYSGISSSSGGGMPPAGAYEAYSRSVPSSAAPVTPITPASPSPAAEAPRRPATTGAGMKLGGSKGGLKLGGSGAAGSALAGLMAEEGLRDKDLGVGAETAAAEASSSAAAVTAASASAAAATADHATITVEEQLTVQLTRDGGCENMEVRGMLTLTVHDEARAKLRVTTRRGDTSAFQFQTHPNLNKPLFLSEGVVALKQADRAFPVGTPIGVLRWRYGAKDTDGSNVPVALTCWPEEVGNGVINVNLEYVLQPSAETLSLRDVTISIPLGASQDAPKVVSCAGTWRHDTRRNLLTWHIEEVSVDAGTGNGTLEFNIRGRDVDVFYPVALSFTSADTLCPIDVDTVTSVAPEDAGKTIRTSVSKTLQVERYEVV